MVEVFNVVLSCNVVVYVGLRVVTLVVLLVGLMATMFDVLAVKDFVVLEEIYFAVLWDVLSTTAVVLR